MNKIFYYIILLVLILLPFNSKSQDEDEQINAKEFYFNFLPNVHQTNSEIDVLYVFITALKPTNVTIEAYNLKGELTSKSYFIEANSYLLEKFDYRDFELIGDYMNTRVDIGSQQIMKCGFHITADENVYVYTLTTSVYSSDAMIVYPVNSLGKKNFVLSYNSDFNFNQGRTPSQFSIIGTEDNTLVKIFPSVKTSKNNTEEFSIILNKGESYLVQAGLEYDSQKGFKTLDLSGSYIEADKNIAVFSGHQRATIPLMTSFNNPSRDFICEQLIPVETWGKDAFITPFPSADVDLKSIKDIFRIISSSDNNKINVGDELITLNRGNVYEAEINEALAIYAEKPIMTAQYKRSSRLGYQDPFDRPKNGDPLMILVPPVEQFLSQAIIFNIKNEQTKNEIFTQQYLVIVASDSAINQCYIDDVLIDKNKFKDIPNSNYSYVIYEYNSGIHYFKSSAKCGLYVYGYGEANSYGYTGGMIPKYIDAIAPEITSEIDCFAHKININDDLGYSLGLKKVELIDSASFNVKINLDDKELEYKKQITGLIELIDNKYDGYFTIKVIDIANNVSFYSDTISGNTLNIANLNQDGKIVIDNLKQLEQNCSNIILFNSGIRSQTINSINHKNNVNYSFPKSQFPYTIRPGEKKPIMICVNNMNSKENLLLDTIFLDHNCSNIFAIIETEYIPIQLDVETKCGLPVRVVVNSIPEELFIEDIKFIDNNTKINAVFGIASEGKSSIKIYDLNGKCVQSIYTGNLAPGIYYTNISISELPTGMYLINISDGINSVSTKIMINK